MTRNVNSGRRVANIKLNKIIVEMFHNLFQLKKSPLVNKIQTTTNLIRTIVFSFNIIIIKKGTRKLLLVLFDNNFKKIIALHILSFSKKII